MKFDPMTGQPIPEGNEQPKFDPATGQPIQQPGNQPAFDPVTGQPINQTPYQGQSFNSTPEKPKKKTGLYIGIGAVVLVAAALIFLVVKVAGMFGSPATKIEKALANTFKESSVFDTSVITESADDLQVDVEFDGKVEGVKIDADLSYAKTNKEMSISGEVGASIISTSFNFYMNQSKVCFDLKGLSNPVYYDFTADKDGDLEDLMGGDFTFDQIDAVLKTIADSDSLVSDFKKAYSQSLKKLDFEKVDSEKFEVNGKDVKCTGYSTTFDKDAVDDMLEAYKEAFDKHEDIVNLIESLSGTDFEDALDSLTDEMDKDSKLEITFYLYKNQVAAIVLEPKGEETIKILFEGGSFPTQNMKVKSGKTTIYEVKGEEKKGVITQEVYTNGAKTSELEYDKNSGELTLTYSDEYGYSELTMSGTYEELKNGFKIEFDNIDYDSYYSSEIEDFNLMVQVTKGANIEKIDIDDDAVDLGNADEDELEDLVSDIASLFGGF